MKSKGDNSYRSILRGTSFFGGVQVFQVLINLVRGKFVAMLLGPVGMGISALFASSAATIQRFASLGLNLAIVKETSVTRENPGDTAVILAVAHRLVIATAFIGGLICIILSKFLSKLTFGDESMTFQFMLLGGVVALTVAFNGKLSMLQGLQEVKRISKASLVGGLTGLLTGVPLYYFFGDSGIVPAMLVLATAMYIFYSVSLAKSVRLPEVKFLWSRHKQIVKTLLLAGLLLMANDLIVSLVEYLINIFIKYEGSTDTVGLYQAANSVTNQYAGVVFTAMAMDYFPRLSKDAGNNRKMRDTVNRQTVIVALMIAPAAALLILTAPVVIRILLTSEFLAVTPLMRWMGLGILIRALTFPMGYIAFAKDNRRLFFWFEGIGCNMLTLGITCVFFHFFGLIGLGYALVVDNLCCLALYYVVNRHLYGYRLNKEAASNMAIAIAIGGGVFSASFIKAATISYGLMVVVTLFSLFWSFRILRRKFTTISESIQED